MCAARDCTQRLTLLGLPDRDRCIEMLQFAQVNAHLFTQGDYPNHADIVLM
jgi:hypothetical protein